MRIAVNCPVCGSRLCDADPSIKIETHIFESNMTNRLHHMHSADLYTKCWKCKSFIVILTMQ